MINRYHSNYSNHVHQLVISVSRHCYVTSQGKFKRQKKPFDVSLEKLNTIKQHIVHFLIRDHFSGLFYAELADSKNMISVYEFLHRAWSPKGTHPFHGVPYAMTIPKSVQKLWPLLPQFIIEKGIGLIEVTSGFQGGVRDVRTWENGLYPSLYESGYPPDYSEVKAKAPHICLQLSTRSSKRPNKETKWRENLQDVYPPGLFEDFIKGYEDEAHTL